MPLDNYLDPREGSSFAGDTQPFLSETQAADLLYGPNSLPGARDVDTTYGGMRVYEWASVGGRKILLMHGDTILGSMLGPIALAPVQNSSRIMLIDASTSQIFISALSATGKSG